MTEEAGKLHQITTRTRTIATIFIVVLCTVLFYSHKFFPDLKDDPEYALAQKKFLDLKKQNKIALSEIKNSVKGTSVYKKYMKINAEKNHAYKEYMEIYNSKKVFGFTSLRYFIERFGFILCIFIYTLYNLIKSFVRERHNIGSKIFHTYILSICFFSFFWIFQKFQDFNRIIYYFMTVMSASVVTYAILLTTKYYKEQINKTREQMFFVARLGLRNSKPEKKEAMLNVFREIADDK